MRNDFDKHFQMAVMAWLFCLVLGLAMWAGIIYVAIHFLGKYW